MNVKQLTIKQKAWVFLTIIGFLSLMGILLITYFLYEKFYIDKQVEVLIARGMQLTDLHNEWDNSLFFERLEGLDNCSEANAFFTTEKQELTGINSPRDDLKGPILNQKEYDQLSSGEVVTIVRRQWEVAQPIIGVAIPIIDNRNRLEGVTFIYKPLAKIFEPYQNSRVWFLLGFLTLILLTIFTLRKLMNSLTVPLNNMLVISEKMADGDFSKRITVKSHDELGALANSFNKLASTLEEEEQKQRQFLSNVSHELRTPLSYIKGYTEGILDDMVDDPKRYLETIYKEADRMQRLVNDLLDLAQLEGDSYPMTKHPIPFAQLIQDVIDRYELVARNKNIIITKHLDHNAIIIGNEDRLQQVIGNILDNALRYSPVGEKIDIVLTSTVDQVVVTITDYGPGIPETSLKKITKRFYRVDKSRSRDDGGTGLGLAIVAEILKKHDAKLNFHSVINEGTSVKVTFPFDKGNLSNLKV